MSSKRTRTGFNSVALAALGLALLSGCSHPDPVALEMFVTDLLRNVAAALLL